MPDLATPTRRSRRKEARPAELLQAALDLFVEQGYAATRVEEVARRAGVSKGTLFLYFPSKEELFKAVVRENLVGQFRMWNDEIDQYAGSTVELVHHCLRQWWERIGATRLSGITKLVMSESAHFPEIANFYQAEVIAPGNELLKRVLLRGIERGEFRPVNLDYGIYGMIAPMIFLIMWKHAMAPCMAGRSALDPDTFIQTQADVLLHGLVRRSPANCKLGETPVR